MGRRPARLVSGGQTGVDRAALDAALELGVPVGGWVPRGRLAEDGRIPDRYPMREAEAADYANRTRLNVRDSDATLIITRGAPAGGTALTIEFARELGRPVRIVDLDGDVDVDGLGDWIAGVETLNVAGPRESGVPGAYRDALTLLRHVMSNGMRIGIDLDNTIIRYDRVFAEAARDLLPDGFSGTKRQIRDALRARGESGELDWQRLQGKVYGALMPMAEPMEGVREFLARCRGEGIPVFVVSHKTMYGHHDPDRVNLRDAALDWLEAFGLFEPGGLAVPRGNVYFEDDREAKIARIAALECTHFIDDLVELFLENGFPNDVEKILYAPGPSPEGPFRAFGTWVDIKRALLGERP